MHDRASRLSSDAEGPSSLDGSELANSRDLDGEGLYSFGEANQPYAFRFWPSELRIERREGTQIALLPKEVLLLKAFANNPGRVLTYESLLLDLQTDEDVDQSTVNTHVSKLRKKLGESAKDQRYIETVHGVGFRFCADVQREQPSSLRGEDANRKITLHGQFSENQTFEIEMYWGSRPTAHADLRKALLLCSHELIIAGIALTTIGDVLNDPQVVSAIARACCENAAFKPVIIAMRSAERISLNEPGRSELAEKLRYGQRALASFATSLSHAVPINVRRPLLDFREYAKDLTPRHFLMKIDSAIYAGSYFAHQQGARSYLMRLRDHGDGLYRLFLAEIEYLLNHTIEYDMAALYRNASVP